MCKTTNHPYRPILEVDGERIICAGFPRCFGRGAALPPRVNSPHRPVSSGADRRERRVSLRDVPRRLLDLQSVKARSDGRFLHRRLHGDGLLQFVVGFVLTRPSRIYLPGELQGHAPFYSPVCLHLQAGRDFLSCTEAHLYHFN